MTAPFSRRFPPNIGVHGSVGRTPPIQHPPRVVQRAVVSDGAPVCPITRGEVPPSQPGIKVPFVPRANDLPSAIDAINKIIDIIATDNAPGTIRWLEKWRVTAIVRITNPDDDSQWVDVERIQQLMMEDQINGDLWYWELAPSQLSAPGSNIDPAKQISDLNNWVASTIMRTPGM